MALYTEKAAEKLAGLVATLSSKPKITIKTEGLESCPRSFKILCGYSYKGLCEEDQSCFIPDGSWYFAGRGSGLVKNGKNCRRVVLFSREAIDFCQRLADWYKENVSCPSKEINIDYHMYQLGVDKDEIFDISVETF